MSIKALVQIECDVCGDKTQTTAEIELNQTLDEPKIELQIIPELPEGWEHFRAFWSSNGHSCPKHNPTK